MAFFQSAVGTLQTFVIALGAGIGIWSLIKEREEKAPNPISQTPTPIDGFSCEKAHLIVNFRR